jgi:hypothetical protein
MTKLSHIEVYPIPGAASSSRAVAYLVFEEESDVNAWPILQRLDTKTYRSVVLERRAVWARFSHWVSGRTHREYHHGWPDDPDFLMGYVFRWDHQRQHRRLYGFITSPRPGFEVCVLCCFRSKDSWLSDPAAKAIVRTMSKHPGVQSAVRNAFRKGTGRSWVH